MSPTSLAMQHQNTVLLQFPSSNDPGTSAAAQEEVAAPAAPLPAAVPVHTKTMQLGGLPSLLRSRKRQRQTNAPTPTPTPPATTTVQVSFGLPFFRLKGFHTPTIVNYSTFLSVMLIMWVVYLILPQGLRRYLCNAHRKRYRKSSPNRIIRTIDGRIKPPPRLNGQNHNDGLKVSLGSSTSFSSEHSNASSVNSALNRGNQIFRAVRRGSPQNRGSNQFNNSTSFGRSDNGVSIERRNVSQTLSNDLSSKSSSKSSHPYFHQHPHNALETNQDTLSLQRQQFISAGSSDLSSIMSTRNNDSNNDNNIETLSSTGSAIWGTPKRFVRKRIVDDNNNIKRINDHNHQNQQIDLLTENNIDDDHHQTNEKENNSIPPSSNPTIPPPALSEVDSFASAFYSTKFSSSSSSSTSTLTKNDDMTSTQELEPSPLHPDLTCGHNVPSHMVLSSTLLSLRDPGIRLFAHGTQCEPRRIWIRLDVANEQLSWRTENVAPSNNNDGFSNGQPDDLVTLGQVHFIPLIQILFIDVGKTTAALQQLDTHDDLCFSILTDGGSLDLQASNKVERDAFVSCMCLILDTVYNHLPPEKSWRRLNDGAGSSVGSSSYSSSSGGTKTQESDSTLSSKPGNGNYRVIEPNPTGGSYNNEVHDLLPYASSSSTGTGSVTGSDVFHGVDLGSQVSATFGEI